MLIHKRKSNKYQEVTVEEVFSIGDENTKRIILALRVDTRDVYGKKRYLKSAKTEFIMVLLKNLSTDLSFRVYSHENL